MDRCWLRKGGYLPTTCPSSLGGQGIIQFEIAPYRARRALQSECITCMVQPSTPVLLLSSPPILPDATATPMLQLSTAIPKPTTRNSARCSCCHLVELEYWCATSAPPGLPLAFANDQMKPDPSELCSGRT